MSKFKVLGDLLPGGVSLPVLRTSAFLLCLHTAFDLLGARIPGIMEGKRQTDREQALWTLHIRVVIPSWLYPHDFTITHQRPQLPTSPQWE